MIFSFLFHFFMIKINIKVIYYIKFIYDLVDYSTGNIFQQRFMKFSMLVYFSSVELWEFCISTWTWRLWINVHSNPWFFIEKEWFLCFLLRKNLLSCWRQNCIVCHWSKCRCSCLVKRRRTSSMDLKWLAWPIFGYQRKSVLFNLFIFILKLI